MREPKCVFQTEAGKVPATGRIVPPIQLVVKTRKPSEVRDFVQKVTRAMHRKPLFSLSLHNTFHESYGFSEHSCHIGNLFDRDLEQNRSLERESLVCPVLRISRVVGYAKACLRLIPSVLCQMAEPKSMLRGKKVEGDVAAWHASSAKSVMLMGKAC